MKHTRAGSGPRHPLATVKSSKGGKLSPFLSGDKKPGNPLDLIFGML